MECRAIEDGRNAGVAVIERRDLRRALDGVLSTDCAKRGLDAVSNRTRMVTGPNRRNPRVLHVNRLHSGAMIDLAQNADPWVLAS